MNKKFIFLIIIFIFTGCFYNEYEMPKDAYIDLNDNVFEVFSKKNCLDLIKDSNVEIISKESVLKTDVIGKNIYTLEYRFKNRKYKYNIEYEVKDSTPPVFINVRSTITMELNEGFPCDKIVYADNYDNVPTCRVNGNFDVTNTGTYDNLEFIVNDASLNEAKKKFKLNVVSEIKNAPYTGNPKYIYMDEILRNYKSDNTSIGIDISKWQGNVDFEKVKNDGIEFVIIQIGGQREANESFEIDSKFNEYYRKAKEAGLKIGVYVYNTSISKEDGIKAAKWVVNVLHGDKLDFPIGYDWENWKNFMNYKISLHTLSDSYLSFEETLKKAGYDSMLYSSKYYLENVWMNYDNSKVWLAHYVSQTDYKGKYMMWQMTSLAKINGITDNTVDIDILYRED